MSTEMRKEPSRALLFSELGSSIESHVAWYHQMQENQPVHYRPEYDMWEVFRYKDVQQVLLNYVTFSVERSQPEGFPGMLGRTDPPRHRQLRNLLFSGHEIKAGQYVVAWTGAANFDEEYFPHSEQFDIRRSPNPHMTFGFGIHVCLGYPLARLEGRIALERIVAHFSEMRPDPENPVQFMGEWGAGRVIRSLGMLFTPASL